jgi:hypothetical protein
MDLVAIRKMPAMVSLQMPLNGYKNGERQPNCQKQIGRSSNQLQTMCIQGPRNRGGRRGHAPPFSVNNKKIPDKIQPAGVE